MCVCFTSLQQANNLSGVGPHTPCNGRGYEDYSAFAVTVVVLFYTTPTQSFILQKSFGGLGSWPPVFRASSLWESSSIPPSAALLPLAADEDAGGSTSTTLTLRFRLRGEGVSGRFGTPSASEASPLADLRTGALGGEGSSRGGGVSPGGGGVPASPACTGATGA